MNPSITGVSHEYTVIGIVCQHTKERPSLAAVSPPPGLSSALWKGLRDDLYRGHFFRTKLWNFVCMVGSLMGAGLVKTVIFFRLNNKHDDDDDDAEEDPMPTVVFFATFFVLVLVSALGFHNLPHRANAQAVVTTWQPKFQAAGWDLRFILQGGFLFQVGLVSLTARPYAAPEIIHNVVV